MANDGICYLYRMPQAAGRPSPVRGHRPFSLLLPGNRKTRSSPARERLLNQRSFIALRENAHVEGEDGTGRLISLLSHVTGRERAKNRGRRSPGHLRLRSSARSRIARGGERNFVHRHDGLPVAATAKGLSAYSTVQGYFYAWRGTWCRINHLVMAAEMEGREASPTAGMIDSQSVKTTEAAVTRLRCRQEDQGPQATHRRRHRAHWSARWFTRPTSRIATAPACSRRSVRSIHGCAMSSPTAAMPATSCDA